MATFRIIAVHLENGERLEHIQKVRATADASGTVSKPITKDVVNRIKTGIDNFSTLVDGYRANVRTNRTAAGTEFIETVKDSTGKDNLLKLPKF